MNKCNDQDYHPLAGHFHVTTSLYLLDEIDSRCPSGIMVNQYPKMCSPRRQHPLYVLRVYILAYKVSLFCAQRPFPIPVEKWERRSSSSLPNNVNKHKTYPKKFMREDEKIHEKLRSFLLRWKKVLERYTVFAYHLKMSYNITKKRS